MSKIMELADHYACLNKWNTTDSANDARAALQAEVEKIELLATATHIVMAERDALRAELDEARKELNTLDVMLEECKMDWSGDVTQIKVEHKHEVDALAAEVEKLEKDAERYRWLRERDDWVLMPGMRSEVCLRSNLDDQIDMSMGAFIGESK